MTPKQADKLIQSGKAVTVRHANGETFTAIFVKRDRRMIETNKNGLFERADLEIIS